MLSWPLKHPWLRERASSSFLNSDQSPVLNKETEQKAGSRPVSQRLWIGSSLPKRVTLAWEPRSRTRGVSPPPGAGIGPAFLGMCCLKTGPYCSGHTCQEDLSAFSKAAALPIGRPLPASLRSLKVKFISSAHLLKRLPGLLTLYSLPGLVFSRLPWWLRW